MSVQDAVVLLVVLAALAVVVRKVVGPFRAGPSGSDCPPSSCDGCHGC